MEEDTLYNIKISIFFSYTIRKTYEFQMYSYKSEVPIKMHGRREPNAEVKFK